MAGPKIKVLDGQSLDSLNALPLSVYIVDYNSPVRNIWANLKCLEVYGVSLENFCSLVSGVEEIKGVRGSGCFYLGWGLINYYIMLVGIFSLVLKLKAQTP